MRITRLGQGVDREGRLGEGAMQRTVEVLAEFRQVMDRLGVTRTRATATAAARDASNTAEFARRVTEVLGTAPEVLDGEEEGRLTYLGATSELDRAEGPYLVIDVGGGSTELVGDGDREPRSPSRSRSAAYVAQKGSSNTTRPSTSELDRL